MVEERIPRKELAIRLLAHGYTTRAVNFRLQDAGHEQYPESELVRLRQQYAAHIDDLREREEIDIRERGLARTSERIRRLQDLAERLEDRILASPPQIPIPDGGVLSRAPKLAIKEVAEYRRILDQIRVESVPLGIAEALNESDPWVILITRLMQSGSDRLLSNNSPSQKSLTLPLRMINGELSDPDPERKSLQEESEAEKVSIPR